MTWAFLLDQFAIQFGLWWVIWPAILLGIVVGILPGFSPQNTLIMLLPLTLAVKVEVAMAFMIALYCANHLAGGIPAILVKIPGSGGAAATTLDGYPMTRKGQGQQALVLCFTASVFGGLITTLATLALLPWLSQLGLYLRSVEMVVVMLFGLTLIAVVAAKDLLKGLIAGFFGLLIGVIGTDHIYNTPRATLGFIELYDGVPLVPALIGLFAISEALVMIEEKMIVAKEGLERAVGARWAETVEGLRLSLRYWWQIVWTSFVGSGDRHHPRRRRERRGVRRLPAVATVVEAPRALRHRHARGRDRARGRQQRGHVGDARPDDGARSPRRQHRGGHDDRAPVPRHGDGTAPLHHQPGNRIRRVRVHGGRVRLHDLHHPAARQVHVAHRPYPDDVPRAGHRPA